MKRFLIYGRFEAEDIDDALQRLADHFGDLAEGIVFEDLDTGERLPLGSPSLIEVRPAAPGEVVMLRAE